jgi:hypothetical protein
MNAAPGYIASMPRDQQDRAGKIRMFVSGRYVNPLDLQLDDIDIRDIGHHLAIVNRYTGGSPFPVSVAQHCVWVSHQFDDPDMQLAGLLHDAPEAYINDLASPVKHDARMAAYRAADDAIAKLVFQKFGLPIELLARTKPADDKAFEVEVASFYTPDKLLAKEVIHEMTWRQAKSLYMARFKSIQWRRGVTD